MPLQNDNKIYPHLTPFTPVSTDQLLTWAQDMTRQLDQLMKQVVDNYNLHVMNRDAHVSAWNSYRSKRPQLISKPSDTSQLNVLASDSYPVRFVINGVGYEVSSDLTLDLDTAGPGGLRSGLTKAAATLYYIYAVLNSGVIALIGDTNAPTTGPTGYSAWTYLGCVSTLAGSSALAPFRSNGDLIMFSDAVSADHTETSATYQAKTLAIPVNASHVFGMFFVSTVSAGSVLGNISSRNAGGSLFHCEASSTANRAFNSFCVPIETAQTIYMKVQAGTGTVNFRVAGWIEDITRFQ